MLFLFKIDMENKQNPFDFTIKLFDLLKKYLKYNEDYGL